MSSDKEKQIIEDNYEIILKFCITKMKYENAELVTQEVFCDFIEKYRHEDIKNPKAYLYSVARSKIAAFYREQNLIRSNEVSEGEIYDLINNNQNNNEDDISENDDEYGDSDDFYVINSEDSNIEEIIGIESDFEVDQNKSNKRRYNKKEIISFDQETLQLKNKIIESLSDEDKKLYTYIYEKKLKHKQIAELENIKLDAVKKRSERLSKKIIVALHNILTKK